MAHIKKGIFPYKLKYQGFNELLNKRNFQVLDQNNKKTAKLIKDSEEIVLKIEISKV